jgi:hypothetical protein
MRLVEQHGSVLHRTEQPGCTGNTGIKESSSIDRALALERQYILYLHHFQQELFVWP